MALLPAPPPPFPGVHPDLASPELGVYMYFIEPAGVLYRYATGTELSVESARWHLGEGEAAYRRYFAGVDRFFFVHDFSTVKGYAPEFRRLITDRGLALRKEIVREVVITSKLNPLFGIGLSTATMALRVVGVAMEISESLEDTIRKYQLRPAGQRR